MDFASTLAFGIAIGIAYTAAGAAVFNWIGNDIIAAFAYAAHKSPESIQNGMVVSIVLGWPFWLTYMGLANLCQLRSRFRR